MTLDERKTLTKVSTCKPLTNIPPKQKRTPRNEKTRKTYANTVPGTIIEEKAVCIITTKGYTLYTDASKYGWAGVLTQLHTTVIDGKTITTDHPVAYVSGLFRGSQINWAA